MIDGHPTLFRQAWLIGLIAVVFLPKPAACTSAQTDNPMRDGFGDYILDSGLEFKSGIAIFLRYEQLHDIDRFAGTTDHHSMLGVRYVW